ncbi:hypothetical protein BBG47_20980 [Paenibacillus sp. KS1]|nr:hypothetical protein BBG47_20980 [Paenibacillus sp. KS1]
MKIFRLHIKAIYPPFNKKYKYFLLRYKVFVRFYRNIWEKEEWCLGYWAVGTVILSQIIGNKYQKVKG